MVSFDLWILTTRFLTTNFLTTKLYHSLIVALRGPALQTWNSRCNGKTPSYDKLVQILKDRFTPDGYQQVHWSNFENRRKRTDETFLEYTDDLRKLVSKSHSHLSEKDQEERIFEQIYRSLDDSQRRLLRIKEIWALGPAIKALTAEENAEQTLLTPWQLKPHETRCWYCKRPDHKRRDCLSYKHDIASGQSQPTGNNDQPCSNNLPSQQGQNSQFNTGRGYQNQNQNSLNPHAPPYSPTNLHQNANKHQVKWSDSLIAEICAES